MNSYSSSIGNGTANSSLKAENPIREKSAGDPAAVRKSDPALPTSIPLVRSDDSVMKSPEPDGIRFELTNETLLTSIIMSEVLGRPKCMRKGR